VYGRLFREALFGVFELPPLQRNIQKPKENRGELYGILVIVFGVFGLLLRSAQKNKRGGWVLFR
jgi:hypothetical protein